MEEEFTKALLSIHYHSLTLQQNSHVSTTYSANHDPMVTENGIVAPSSLELNTITNPGVKTLNTYYPKITKVIATSQTTPAEITLPNSNTNPYFEDLIIVSRLNDTANDVSPFQSLNAAQF
ncbi:hypothetical protein POM88_001251 [Heracleum sosnowskyi]|uniref:Uncharacterized protein n=1 Tax=Heracleum sosnowskyi TaxID=360622 RepID=A0AAD8JDB9_9APIA|nr:hypothetical protein POM88_001251 [Heracleum sosnowskyi]